MQKRAKKHFSILAAVAIFALAFIAAGTAQGAAPQQISIQGKLTDSVGKILDGSYQLKFDFLDASSGALVKSVGPQTVAVKKGFFTAFIAPPAGLNFNVPYLVDVSVNGQKLAPSFVLSYAPYSIRAVNAGAADTAAALSGTIGADKITGQLTAAQIPVLSADKIPILDGSKLGANAVTGDKILNGAISADDVGFIAGGTKSGKSSYTIIYSQDSQYGRKSAFTNLPAVVCSPKNLGRYCSVTSIGVDQFTATVFDSASAPQTDTIYWIAIGS